MSESIESVSKTEIEGFPVDVVRQEFPALSRARPFIYFDNAAGAQSPIGVIDRVSRHLVDFNVQRGGRYSKSVEVDRVIAEARSKAVSFVNGHHPDEIAFGLNATSFIRMVSLAIGQTLTPSRNEFIVTDIDHDANVATWMALRQFGARVIFWRMREDYRLHVDDLLPLLSDRTRLVACTAVSHALGSFVDVTAAAKAAHDVGADIFVDAVHFGPHALIDVKAWGCDFLVCSGYKAFSPHMGFLWGLKHKLDPLQVFREDFIPDESPYKFEAGTFSYENVAGFSAAMDYLGALGARLMNSEALPLRANLASAMVAIQFYERVLSQRVLEGLSALGATIYGIDDADHVANRVPTVCFNIDGLAPAEFVSRMAIEHQIGIRDGHMYAPNLMGRLGLSMSSGAVRVSLVHYNTVDEVDNFIGAARKICLR